MKIQHNLYSRTGVLLLSLVLLVAGCGKEGTREVTSDRSTIVDIEDIANAADRRSLVGKNVDIRNAKVQQVVGNYVFWAGDPHTSVPIAREDKMRGPVTHHVKPGS